MKTFTSPIIGLHGAGGTGKSEMAIGFRTFVPSMVRLSLADPIKEFLHLVFDIKKDNLWGSSNLRNAPLYFLREAENWDLARFRFSAFRSQWLERLQVRNISTLIDWFDEMEDLSFRGLTPPSSRDFCVSLGEIWGRQQDPYIWTRYLAQRINTFLSPNRFGPSPFGLVVVDDVRKNIDIQAIVDWGGAVITVRREGYVDADARKGSDDDVYSPFAQEHSFAQFTSPQHDAWGAARVTFLKRFVESNLKDKHYAGQCREWLKA